MLLVTKLVILVILLLATLVLGVFNPFLAAILAFIIGLAVAIYFSYTRGNF